MLSLKTLIIREKFAARPTRVFRARLWETLSATLPPVTRHDARVLLMKKMAVGFAIILPFVMGGTSAYAYSSPSVTEGNVLYPVKRGIETVRVHFATSPEDRTTIHLQLYERRLDEAERLLETRALMIQALNDAVDEDDQVNGFAETEQIDAMMREKFAQDLLRIQSRYETVRLRVRIGEPSDASSLRDPSFMIRKTQSHD